MESFIKNRWPAQAPSRTQAMDPLSITASAIAISTVTTELITRSRSYYKSVKDSRLEIAELLRELESFDIVLKSLKELSQKADETNKQQSDKLARNGMPQQEACPLPTLKNMLEAKAPLSLCYNEMLIFKAKLTKDQSTLKKSLKWPFRKDEIKAVISQLRNLKSLLDTAIHSDQLALSIKASENITHTVNTLNAATKKDLIRCLSSWFSAPDPSSNLNAAQTKRQKNTGVWLLKSPIFLGWKSADHSLLWLHGKAGSGKTILSSAVIHNLRDNTTGDTIVVYFYFDFQTHEKQLFQSFLNSIVVQLFNHDEHMSAIVEELYNAYHKGSTMPTIQDTLLVFRRMIDAAALSVFVVIDALDECRDRTSLLEGLNDIRSWNQKNLHIFVTSRQETEIENILRYLTTDTISLEESVVDEDILTYVRYQLQHEHRLSKWSEDIRVEIETALVKGANGMFRWVECQLDAIRGCMKLGLLRKALRTLPSTLDETYSRILGNIPEEYIEDARRILSYLVCAFRPLAIEEVAETLAIMIEGEDYYDMESQLQDPRNIITICSGLVSTIDFRRANGKSRGHGGVTVLEGLRLAHFSVKEYLMSDRIAAAHFSRFALNELCAHEVLANLCVNYLLWCGQEDLCQDTKDWLAFRQTSHRSVFALYAASFWSDHLQAAHLDSSAPLYNRCLQMITCPVILRNIIRLRGIWFCEGNGQIGDFLVEYLFRVVEPKSERADLKVATGAVPPLLYVSILGLDELVLKLLAAGENPNSIDAGSTCLAAAAFFGHGTTARLLLDKGAEVNAVVHYTEDERKGYYSPAAIQCAAETGREDVVKMLLAEGADLNTCRTQPGYDGIPGFAPKSFAFYKTPLEAAISKSGPKHTKIVQVLLDEGADIHADRHWGSARFLIAPICEENIDLMTILLDAGVDPNEDDGMKLTPLVWAISAHRLKSIELLVRRGATLEGRESRVISALYDVRDSQQFGDCLEKALELKPNLNTEKLFMAAAKYGQIGAVRHMLRNGTAPDIHDENGVAALHAAAFTPRDNTQILKLLLNATANINIHGGLFGSALQAAALSGKARAVRMLLERGASPDYAGGSYGTALQIAQNRLEDLERGAYTRSWHGNLLEWGPDGYYDPTLHYPNRHVDDYRAGGDYIPHFDFSHMENADYRTIINALQSHGAS